MLRTVKRTTLLLLIAALAVMLMVPGGAWALATYEAVGGHSVASGNQDLGRVKITIPAAELSDNDYFTLELPADFRFNIAQGSVYALTGSGPDFALDGNNSVTVSLPQAKNAFYDPAAGYGDGGIGVQVLTERMLKFNLSPSAAVNSREDTAYLYVNLNSVYVPDSSPSTISVNIEGPGFAGQTSATTPGEATPALFTFFAEGGPVRAAAGIRGLTLNPLIIKEGIKSAIDPDTYNGQVRHTVRIEFPPGVTCTSAGSVEVTAGDLVIDETSLKTRLDPSTKQWGVEFEAKSGSTLPATVRISAIQLDLSSDLAQGQMKAELKGNAILKTLEQFPGQTSLGEAAVADITAPASAPAGREVRMTVGSTACMIDGQSRTMDVAPYIKAGRVMAPLYFVSEALGASVNWNGANQTITLIKGSQVVQFAIGSSSIIINGAAVTTDVPPEISRNRTMLPAGAVARALGAAVAWDGSAQSVTIK